MTELHIVNKYGKQSIQHLQYLAVLHEDTIVQRYGRQSLQHQRHLEYMRQLNIPVIG